MSPVVSLWCLGRDLVKAILLSANTVSLGAVVLRIFYIPFSNAFIIA